MWRRRWWERSARVCSCVEAKTKLVYNPPVRSLLVFGYPDIFAAADHVVEPAKFGPVGLEALDDTFIDYMKKKGPASAQHELHARRRCLALDRVRRQR